MKAIIFGANGRNGINLQKISADDNTNFNAVALVDTSYSEDKVPVFCDARIYTSLSDVDDKADVLIDFSYHGCTTEICEWSHETKVPLVIATTGQTSEEMAEIDSVSKVVPVFKSANMSVGVGLTCELVRQAAKSLPGADIEIVEAHHNKKLDAPSGTAIMLAEAAKSGVGAGAFVYGRSGQGARKPKEIGISALRLGNIVGEHSVLIDTGYEQIEIKHRAHDRMLFAQGAVRAAEFMQGKAPGLYTMEDLLCE